MKIENISEGQIIKNYKALCTELEVPVEAGNSKKAQLKEWERYFSYVKQGNKFIITEVFEAPKEKIETRGRKSVYGDMVQLLITDMLANSNQNVVILSRNKLLQTINMINENYIICNHHVKELSEITDVEQMIIYDFYNNSSNSLKYAVESALESLEKKCVIWHDRVIKVCIGGRIHRLATDEEKILIVEAKREMLKRLGYSNVDDLDDLDTEALVRKSKDYFKFKKGVMSILKEDHGISYYYKAYKIGISHKYIGEERDKLIKLLLDDCKREEVKKELNHTVIEKFKDNAEDRHENSIYSKSKMSLVRYDSEYPNKVNKLIDLLIDKDMCSIYEEIMSVIRKNNKLDKELSNEIEDSMNELFA